MSRRAPRSLWAPMTAADRRHAARALRGLVVRIPTPEEVAEIRRRVAEADARSPFNVPPPSLETMLRPLCTCPRCRGRL